jgi:hypothetical protein
MLFERRASPHARKGVHPDSLLPERVGLLPYITIEGFERLKVAFRQYRQLLASGGDTELVEGNIILYAGWLGHYVADAANPHHISVRFEGDFVRSAGIRAKDFSERLGPPELLEDPFADFLGLIHESQGMVEETYRLDKAGGFEGTGSPEGLEFTLGRLAAGSQMLLDLWYTAWVTSRD